MKKLTQTLIFIYSICLPSFVFSNDLDSDIKVIVNADIELESLNKKQIMALFLGRTRSFPNGEIAKAFDNKVGSPTRKAFFEQLTGKSIADIDAYWARLRYSGRASPPREVSPTEALVAEVAENKSAIAYVSGLNNEALKLNGVKVVYILGLPQ